MEKSFDNIEDLANFVFINNSNNSQIDMVMHQGVSSSKELFFVCVELLTNGMKLLYGDANGKVTIQNIDVDKLNFLKSKLSLTKINFEIDIVKTSDLILEINIDNDNQYKFIDQHIDDKKKSLLKYLTTSIEDYDDNLPLNEYCFNINIEEYIYFIQFNIIP